MILSHFGTLLEAAPRAGLGRPGPGWAGKGQGGWGRARTGAGGRGRGSLLPPDRGVPGARPPTPITAGGLFGNPLGKLIRLDLHNN